MIKIIKYISGILCAAALLVLINQVHIIFAEQTVPRTLNYQGVLIDNNTGNAYSGNHNIRFSLWSDRDYDPAVDTDGAGNFLPNAPDFSGWSEEQTFTVDSNGIFNVEIGAGNPLPNLYKDIHRYLQVEIKEIGAPVTAYELIDPEAANTAIDRSPLNSAPFAINTDYLDNREIGTGSGDIAILNQNEQWDIDLIPGGTNESIFVLDVDNNAEDTITLQFGDTLGRMLSYDIFNNRFILNDDLLIQGDLHVENDFSASGNVILGNSNIDQLFINATLATDFDFNQNEALNFVLHKGTAFPLAPVAGQKFFRTDLGEEYVYDGVSWINIIGTGTGILSGIRKSIIISPEYPGFTLIPDGTNNIGTMYSDYEDVSGSGKYIFYKWTTEKTAVMQDFDICLRIALPSDFGKFQTIPIEFTYKTTSGVVAFNTLDVSVFDSIGNAMGLNNATNLASTNWAKTNITFTAPGIFKSNTMLIMKIKMSAIHNNFPYAGDIQLNYITR